MDAVGKKALKAGTWYTICTFVLKGLSFITMPIFARIMTKTDVGAYSNLISWIAILSPVLTLDLYTSINLAHYEYEGKIYQFMSTVVLAGTMITAALYGIACFFTEQLTSWMGISEYMLHVMFLYLLVHPALSCLHVKFRVYMQYKGTIITSLIPAVVSVLLSLLLVLMVPEDEQLSVRVISYHGVWIAVSLAIYIFILARGRCFKLSYVKFAIPIALPMVLHLMSNTLLTACDRVMITHFDGKEANAMYSTAYSCAMIVNLLWASVNQAWAPWVYEKLHREEDQDIGVVARPIILIFAGGVLLLTLLAPELLLVMGGRKYMDAVGVIPPVMLGYIAQMLYTMYVNIEFYYKKQKQIMMGTFATALLNILLNLIFVPLFGYVAAAYTTLAGYVALFFIHYLFVRKMGRHGIYNIRFNLTVLVVSCVLGISMTLLYDMNILRWIMVGAVGLFVIGFMWKRRKALIKSLKKKDIEGILKICKLM